MKFKKLKWHLVSKGQSFLRTYFITVRLTLHKDVFIFNLVLAISWKELDSFCQIIKKN